MGLILLNFLSPPELAWQKGQTKLDLLTDINILLRIEKGIKGEICHAIHKYEKANNKYMRNHNKNQESSYLTYWELNNLYRLEMS